MGPAIGSAGARYTRGTNILDIRSFGASPKADGRTNRLAIQQALDIASQSQARNRIGVYVPSGSYQIDKSLFVRGQELDFFGDGPGASTIVGTTSMLHLGMKKSVIDPSQNVLVDAYGRLDTTVVTGPGWKYGLDLNQYRLCDQVGLMFRNGDRMWADMRQFAIDVVFDMTAWTDPSTAYTRASICGWENASGVVPGEPWFIEVERSSNLYRVNFWLSLEKNAPRESTPYMISTDWFANPFVRFTAQVDLDGHNGGHGPVVVLYLNRVQVEPVIAQGASAPNPGGRLLNNYLRMFTVGARTQEGPAPIKMFGLRVQEGPRYKYQVSGFPQSYLAGGAISDQDQYFVVDSRVLFQVPFAERPTDLADHPSMLIFGASYSKEMAPLSSKSATDSELIPFGLVAGTISDLCLQSVGAGAGILMNGTANSAFFNLRIMEVGTAISTFGNVSYANYFNNLDLDAKSAILALRSSSLQSFTNVITRSSSPHVFIAADSSSEASVENWLISPNVSTWHYVYSEGASFKFKNVAADNEGFNLRGCCDSYFDALGVRGSTVVEFEWTGAGTGSYRKPCIVLGGPSSRSLTDYVYDQPMAFFSFKSPELCEEKSQPGLIRVDSPCWHGELRQDGVYERGPFVLDNTLHTNTRVKVHDFWLNGPPRSSYWSKGMGRIHPPDVVSGRPLEYVCSSSGGYGTATPPRWHVSRVCDDDPTRLAADLMGHSYWSAGATPAVTVFGYWSDAVQVQNMDWIFHQTAPSIPGLPTALWAALSTVAAMRSGFASEVAAGLGYSKQRVTFTFPTAGRAEASTLSFGAATGSWDDGGASSLTGSVGILDASGNLIASVDFAPRAIVAGDTVSFASGEVFQQSQPVSRGGFSLAVEDALAKAWLGGGTLPVWNLYLALSTGVADPSRPPVEPADTAYRRVVAPSSVWTSATDVKPGTTVRGFPKGRSNAMLAELAVISNSQSLEFPAATTDWGTVRSVYLMDAASGGNVLAAADLIVSRTVKSGDAALGFDVGAFRVVRS